MAVKRNSLQKKAIKDALAVMDHPTAVEVYERLHLEHPQISLGTVYRNLGTMASEGAALRLSFTGAADRFDPNTHEHYHALCSSCGAIFDGPAAASEQYANETVGIKHDLLCELDRDVERSTGVRVQRRSLVFEGLCSSCNSGTTARGR